MRAIAMCSRLPGYSILLFFLVATRLLLNLSALIGVSMISPGIGVAATLCPEPRSLPCLWASWDGDFYLKIALNGYSNQGVERAFFPLYPIFIKLVALGIPALYTWSGFLVSNVAFVVAGFLLWQEVNLEFGPTLAWETIALYTVFPTSLFFSALYSESLFLLFSILVYWFAARKRYAFSALCVGLASVTRANGILLFLIVLIEMYLDGSLRDIMRTVVISSIALAGWAIYGTYMWLTQGSPLAFFSVQSGGWGRSIAFPWQTLWDGILVVLGGTGSGRTDLLITLGFVVAAVLAFSLVRKSWAVYFAATMCFLLTTHGPVNDPLYSMARFVLGLFPGFVVMAILLQRTRQLRWVIWVLLAIRLVISTMSFASGQWVA